MRARRLSVMIMCYGLLLALTLLVAQAQGPVAEPQAMASEPLGTGFTYQGRLLVSGSPLSGICDLQFTLWDAATGGTQIGSPQSQSGLSVSNGLFTVVLDFGAAPFGGDARWLEVTVRSPAGTGGYTTLTPRQPLTAVPYALYARTAPWGGIASVPPGFADGVDNDTLYGAGTGLSLVGTTFNVLTATIQQRVAGACGSGYAIRQVNADGTVVCEPAGGGTGTAWQLTGNAGTIPGTHFLGTTDNQALEFKVNGARALRLEPNATSPNVLGGYNANSVTGGVWGATIGGGGSSGSINQVSANYGTVSGGEDNTASGNCAAVGGGYWNRAQAIFATVGGGGSNDASDAWATVGGGLSNTASGRCATVPGGEDNAASGQYSFAAGRRANALHDGVFVWADSTFADFASTGADQFLVRASNGVKVVREASSFAVTWAALQIDQGGSGEAAWLYTANASHTAPVLKLAKNPNASGNFIDGVDRTSTGTETRKFHIDKNGTFVAGSDFAEALPVAGDPAGYEPGDVLVISLDQSGGVEKSRQPYDSRVLGVYSTRPGFLGADKAGVTQVMAGEVPVAVLGIVPVKVSTENGPIEPGDLLTTSSTPGHAMRCEGLERCFGRTLGKALQGLAAGQSTGVIQALVSLQ